VFITVGDGRAASFTIRHGVITLANRHGKTTAGEHPPDKAEG